LSRAVLKYNVPLYVLARLALDGRIEAVHGVDEKGAPAIYVKEDDVREVAKYIRLEEKESVEGGENGG
jgi:acyl-CoA synthetase (NDP forming)